MLDKFEKTGMPLDGIRVLDFGHHMAGPYCAMLLAQFGAEVIKVEPPGGDPQRSRLNSVGAECGPVYRVLNRGKLVAPLDIKSPSGRATFGSLVAGADIFVTNHLPATLRRLGLDPATLTGRHHGLIYISLTGAGWGEGYENLAVDDGMAQALSGLMWATGWPDDGPVYCPVPISAVAAGLHAAIAAVAALHGRLKGRRPAPVGVSLLDALAFCQEYTFMHAANLGKVPQRNGGRHPTGTPSQIFATSSGYLAVMAPSDREFSRLCDALRATDMSADARFETMIDRLINRDALTHELERLLARDTAENWFAALSEAGIACAPVRRIADVPGDALATERRLFSVRHANDALPAVCVAVPDGARARTGLELPEPRVATEVPVSWRPRVDPQYPVSGPPLGRPLAGISVVDLTRYLAGPFATTLLADLGASVLKLEPKDGDPARGFGPAVHGTSGYFASVNRGKDCRRIDLRSAEGIAQLQEALRYADLLIENFRPGTLSRIGISGEEPGGAGTRAQTVSISGFGQRGTLSRKAAYDMTMQAFCGIMEQTGSVERPTRLGFSLGDIAAGLFAALSATVRLVGAERGLASGGQADVAMADALYAVMESLLTAQASGVAAPTPSGAQHVDAVPQGAFPCRDGHIYIAAASDFDFVDLWHALHLGSSLRSADFGTLEKRRTRRSELVAVIAAETGRHRRDDLVRLLSGAGIRVAPVLSVAECLDSAYFRDAGLIVGHPEFPDLRVVRTPFVDLSGPAGSCVPRIENPIEENVP